MDCRKRRRVDRDWTALPTEMLETIANRLTLIEDYNAFRGVCTSWRAVETKFVSKVPLLMLSENDGGDEREFYSVAKGRVCMRIPLPGAPAMRGKRCINAGYGWVLTTALSSDADARIIQLPNISTFPGYSLTRYPPTDLHYIRGVLLTGDPSETSDFTVILSVFMLFGFWRNGDQNWTRFMTDIYGFGMLYRKEEGNLYTMDLKGHLLIWGSDLTEPKRKVNLANDPIPATSRGWSWHNYLVDIFLQNIKKTK